MQLTDGMRAEYGDVLTFVLFKYKMTVALGSKGNNFIPGGKTANLSAEDMYVANCYAC